MLSGMLQLQARRCTSIGNIRSRFATFDAASSLPSFMRHRAAIWDQEIAPHLSVSSASATTEPIAVELIGPNGSGDGRIIQAISGQSTPFSIARDIKRSLADDSLVAKVNGQLWDLHRPLSSFSSTSPVQLQLFSWDTMEGKQAMWHTSAHALGYALESVFGEGTLLHDGPATESGFFYDVLLPNNATLSSEQLHTLEKAAEKLLSGKHPLQRAIVSRETALKLFSYSPLKTHLISSIPEGDELTVYRCGDFIDLCRGPHLPILSSIKAFSALRTSSSHAPSSLAAFLSTSSSTPVTMQRVYGISFPKKTMLEEWKKQQEEAAKRDHRTIGRSQGLFMFHPWSPGSAFFYPPGTRIFSRLTNLIRNEYRKRGYEEVISPLIYNKKLWETSGHWQNYRENMFIVSEPAPEQKEEDHSSCCGGGSEAHQHGNAEEEIMGLKPMNCPGHCLMFSSRSHSYRDLPVRWADFSALHRNEVTGALTGLTRVRRFHQDDAHIFCTEQQVHGEITDCLDFVRHIYGIFGFKFSVKLSTRPEKHVGSIELWDRAESSLRQALDAHFSGSWVLNPGDGAFYGPKIDISVTDALGRQHQCATIQLDFNLPQRFELKYTAEDGTDKTPVMIHRAILGSVERMFAILTEHFGGRWPLWLNPRQIAVIPVSEKTREYGKTLRQKLHDAGFHVDLDDSDKTLQKRIRDAQMAQYNLILVVGDEEAAKNTVSVRSRDDNAVRSAVPFEQFLEEASKAVSSFK